MTKKEFQNLLSELSERGIRPGLDNIRKLMEKLGNIQNKIRAIHIAGTDGKGSVGAFIAGALYGSGYKTGHFSSPAVLEYNEMFTLDGEPIDDNTLYSMAEKVKLAAEGIPVTKFEFECALAFLFFYEQKCDFAVIECGMGGLTDATNVIDTPLASVITSIGMDHTAYLGDTLEEIATQKAGIIKNAPVFSAKQPMGVCDVLNRTARSHGTDICYVTEPKLVSYSYDEMVFNYTSHRKLHDDLILNVGGKYQADNASLCIEVLDFIGELGYNIDVKKISRIKRPCRFETVSRSPLIILDGAHNPHGVQALCDNFAQNDHKSKLLIMGVFKDKDYHKMLDIFSRCFDAICAVNAFGERALPSHILAQEAKNYFDRVYTAESVNRALELCESYDVTVIAGSLSYLADFRNEILSNYK